MTSRLEQLIKQRDLQQKLAEKQLESLNNKQDQLKLLEQKLAQLEVQQPAINMQDKIEGTITTELASSLTTARAAENNDEMVIMDQLMQDAQFKSKFEELNRQSRELAMLEEQLNSLKGI